MLAPYRQLLAVPHLASVLGWALVGRLHLTCTSIALTFLVAEWTGSYAVAGVVVAAATLGWGVGGPLRGRAADRGHPAHQLVVTGVIYTAGMAAMALLPAGWWPVAVPLAFGTGLSVPATGQIARAMYPRMANGPALDAAYTAEATLQELLFVLGPVAAAGTVALAGPRAAVGLCAVLALLGSLGFAFAIRRTPAAAGSAAAPPDAADGRLFAVPGLAAALVTSMLMVAAFTAVGLALVAWARERGTPALAGLLSAMWAIGSFTGGLVTGGLAGRRAPRLWLRLGVLSAGMAVLTLTLPPVNDGVPPLLVAAVLLAGGTAIAPAAAANNVQVGLLAPAHRRSEVFGWMATGRTSGSALAAPVAGALMDAAGPAAATAAATVLALAAAALAGAVPQPDRASTPDRPTEPTEPAPPAGLAAMSDDHIP